MRYMLGTLLAGMLVAPGEAQQAPQVEELEGMSLEDILNTPVVTASGGAEQRSIAAASVFSISGEEIRRRGWRSLEEILAQVPGLYLVADHVSPSVGVRQVTGGFQAGTRIVKVMINGHAVSFRPELNALIGPEFLPVEAIERVEVAKGPMSALYGANAFLATVNVITRRPTSRQSQVAARVAGVEGNLGYGASGFTAYGDENKSVLVALTGERMDRSGLEIERTFPAQSAALLGRASEGDLSTPLGGFASLQAKGAFGELAAEGGFQHRDAVGEFQLNSVLTHRSRITLTNRWGALQYQKGVTERVRLRAQLGIASGEPNRDYVLYLTGNTSSSYRPNDEYDALTGVVEATYEAPGGLSVKVGGDVERSREQVLFYTQVLNRAEGNRQPLDEIELIQVGDERRKTMRQIGGYAQVSASPVENLRLTGNFRLDTIEFGEAEFPLQYSWRAAAAYRWNSRFTTKLFAGRAFQTPSGTLLFAHAGFGNVNNVLGSRLLGQTLDPQRVSSVELAGTAQLGRRFSLEGSVFYQKLSDAIAFQQTGTFYVAANSGERETMGGELTARLIVGALRPYGSLSLTRAVGAEAEEGAPSLYPNAFGDAGVEIDLRRLRTFANVQVDVVGRRGASQPNVFLNDSRAYELPGHVVAHATLSTQDLHWLSPSLATRVLVSVRNLGSKRFAEPGFGGIDVPQLGRVFLLEIRQGL